VLSTPTVDKLHALKLPALAYAWSEQQQSAELGALSFDERFGLLVDAEWLARDNKRVARALREAKLSCPRPASRPSTTRLAASSTRLSCVSSPPPSVASLVHDPSDRRVRDRPIWVFSLAGIRSNSPPF
jgi:hypothetical protein